MSDMIYKMNRITVRPSNPENPVNPVNFLRAAACAFVEEKARLTCARVMPMLAEPTFKVDPKAPYAHPYYWAPFILIGNWK